MLHSQVLAIAMAVSSGVAGADAPQAIPDDLHLLIGKQVIVGRLPLCIPHTYTTDISYMGKAATVVSLKESALPELSPSARRNMAPAALAMFDDIRKGGILLFKFADGVSLDSCVDLGLKKIAEELQLAPGQVISLPDSPSAMRGESAGTPLAASGPVAVAKPQNCPVAITKITSGSGGFGHFLVEAMTTSEFQRQLDETEHGGAAKHYLDIRMRNLGDKPITAIEGTVIYSNKMGDESGRRTLISQNKKPIAPGQEERAYAMDRDEAMANGIGQVELYISRIRFVDNTFWIDDGSHSCALSSDTK